MKHALVLGLLLLLSPLALSGAAPPAPPVFSSEVALVLLPVFVVGPDGRAARGLSADDFDLQEDGKRMPVVSFRYVDTTSEEDQDAIREASAARRRFLLLFDRSFTDPAGFRRAQRAAADFVRARMATSDLAAVATFDLNSGVNLLANFTEDRAFLLGAIEGVGLSTRARISDPLALAQDMAGLDVRGGRQDAGSSRFDTGGLVTVLTNQMRAAEVEAYRGHISLLISHMQELAKALRRVEGRKQVLYFSSGFDSRLLIGQSGEEQKTTAQSSAVGRLWEVDGATRFGDTKLRQDLSEMTRAFTGADAVIHTIDVTGLAGAPEDFLNKTFVTVDPSRPTGGRESLNFIAAETGGRFFRDANNLEPLLRQMLDMTSRYYVLGFQPAGSRGPGVYHKIKVRVSRKGTQVSHRPGYFEREPLTGKTVLLQRQFEAAELIMGDVGRNDLKLSSMCLPLPSEGDRQRVALVVQVPAASLEWSQGRPSTLELYAYAVGDDGTAQDHIAQLARIDPVRRPAGESRGVSFSSDFSVPPGRYTLRMLVVERETGATGVQMLDLKVPPFDPRSGVLLPPVVVEDADQWLKLDMARGKESGDRTSPFDVGGRSLVPRTSFEVRGGTAERMVLVAYEPVRPGDPATDVQLHSSLTGRDGKLVAPGMMRIEKVYRQDDGRRTFVLGYTPDALAPGDYTLRIALGEGGERLESYSLLRVRPGS
jgi:VWFA-related protein